MMKTGKKRAFTLIETLIVVGIIGVLAALLLVAFGPARETARKATCVSNYNQISKALAMYRSDYDGMEAVVGHPVQYSRLGLPAAGDMFDSFWKVYLKNRDVLFCPDWHHLFPNDPRPLSRDSVVSTYSWLVPPEEDGMPPFAQFSQRVSQKGDTLVISDCPYHNPPYDPAKAARWLTKRINFLRLNGHVESKQVPINSSNMDW